MFLNLKPTISTIYPRSSKRRFLFGRMMAMLMVVLSCLFFAPAIAQKAVPVAEGWARNSVNTVVFRKSSLATLGKWQYIAYYDSAQNVVVGKRKINSTKWTLQQTGFKGRATDAHRCISLAVDGNGYLHIAWDEHDNQLNYARSTVPNEPTFSEEQIMTGEIEKRVTYPEFYRLANGDLLFLYRNGMSGQGNLVMNKYDVRTQKWTQLQSNLIDGEGQRSAYWQCWVDKKGAIHLSWVWRESPDVASNHDLCYAVSRDGGITWQKSSGEKYVLPITQATAEYAQRIPQKSELINQTSMTGDDEGNPYIITYWRDAGTDVPQYHLVFLNGGKWQVQSLNSRMTAFSLSGGGTKRIPISRPQIICKEKGGKIIAGVLFRDEERGSRVSLAVNKDVHNAAQWEIKDIYQENVGSWEPTFDVDLWKAKKRLDVFVQKTEQADAEGLTQLPPQMIYVLQGGF